MADVSQRRIGKSAFSGSKFGTERRFHLAAGILCKPFVKKVLERHKIRKSFFGVLIFSHSNVSNLLFREHKFQIVVHHHVFTAKATEVFGNDAVDLSGLHIIHHPLKAGTLKICSAPSVIDIFAIHRKTMFLCILLQNSALGLDTHAVAIVFVVTAETHIECGIVRLFHGKNPPSNRNNPRLQYFCFYYTVSVGVVQRHFVVGLSSVAGGILDHIFNQRVHGLSRLGEMLGYPNPGIAAVKILNAIRLCDIDRGVFQCRFGFILPAVPFFRGFQGRFKNRFKAGFNVDITIVGFAHKIFVFSHAVSSIN